MLLIKCYAQLVENAAFSNMKISHKTDVRTAAMATMTIPIDCCAALSHVIRKATMQYGLHYFLFHETFEKIYKSISFEDIKNSLSEIKHFLDRIRAVAIERCSKRCGIRWSCTR